MVNGKLHLWLRDFLCWLKPTITLIALPVGGVVYILVNVIIYNLDIDSFNALQMSGLILQVMGSVCIVPSLLSRAKKSFSAGFTAAIKKWFRNMPLLVNYFEQGEKKDSTVFVSSSELGISMEAVSIEKQMSTEERFTELEAKCKELGENLELYKKETQKTLEMLFTNMESSEYMVTKNMHEIRDALKKMNREGLEWEIAGATWLILGSVLATLGTILL